MYATSLLNRTWTIDIGWCSNDNIKSIKGRTGKCLVASEETDFLSVNPTDLLIDPDDLDPVCSHWSEMELCSNYLHFVPP